MSLAEVGLVVSLNGGKGALDLLCCSSVILPVTRWSSAFWWKDSVSLIAIDRLEQVP